MRQTILIVWYFILLVVGYDCCYAVSHADSLHEWEMNPVAIWMVNQFGLACTVAFRMVSSLASAILLNTLPASRLTMVASWLIGLAHLGLAITYLILFVER